MPDAPSFRTFFGDQDRTFRLGPELVTELERKTGRGIGGLCRDLFAGDFHLLAVTETIRLGLVGGGTDPKEAASLIAAYVTPRPIMDAYALAVAILETAMLGRTGKKGRGK
jgi:hypothetical protein